LQTAGLNCLRLLNETTATALAYGIYKTDLPEGEPVHVVFVDVGYASTQVCVVALKKGQLQVLSNAWDRDLGGRNFDQVLFNHFVKEFQERYKIDVRGNMRACHRLRMGCEKMKKVLTTNPEAPISVECIMNDVDVQGVIARDVFEEEARDVLGRLLNPVKKVWAWDEDYVGEGNVGGGVGGEQSGWQRSATI
jgi:heat shock protein 4